jgi:hypothetical protein
MKMESLINYQSPYLSRCSNYLDYIRSHHHRRLHRTLLAIATAMEYIIDSANILGH